MLKLALDIKSTSTCIMPRGRRNRSRRTNMEDIKTVACTLTETGMSERRRRWHELANRSFVCRVETERGLQMVFRAGVGDELRELALLERDCCTFASWEVITAGGHA